MKLKTSREKKIHDDGFTAGVTMALYCVWQGGHGDDVMYDDITANCGPLDVIVTQAKRDGNYTNGSGLREAVVRERWRARSQP